MKSWRSLSGDRTVNPFMFCTGRASFCVPGSTEVPNRLIPDQGSELPISTRSLFFSASSHRSHQRWAPPTKHHALLRAAEGRRRRSLQTSKCLVPRQRRNRSGSSESDLVFNDWFCSAVNVLDFCASERTNKTSCGEEHVVKKLICH